MTSKVTASYLIVIAGVLSTILVFSVAPGVGFYDNQRFFETLCTLLTAIFSCSYLFRFASFLRLCNSNLISQILLFFLLGAVSSIFAHSPRYALFEWANFLLLLAMLYLVALELATKNTPLLNQILRLCALGCAAYILLEIIVYMALIIKGTQPPNESFIFGFDNYRFFNHVQTITLPLLALLICRSSGSKQNIFAWAVTSIWWTLLFVTAGRGTFIGLLAGMFVTWFCLRKDALQWCRTMLWSALIGLGIYILFYVLVPLSLGLQPFGFLFSVVDRTMENPSSSRWALWARAWELMLAHPWLGVGPLHFAHYGRDLQLGAHPHNWILQIGCEWGIPALLCLMAAIGLGLKRLLAVRQYLDTKDVKNHTTLAAWLTIGVAILVDGLVSGLIVMPTSQLWIALYIGCAWGWTASMTPAAQVTTVRLSMTMRVGGIVILLASIYFLFNGLWPEILNLPAYEEQNLQKELYPHPLLRPRIWAGGYF
ncbi:O-antigen ligase family protein [Collimonas arenae]|uniref:O-antigen ligase family protein n=1 Tax=Collimonas arenae TaxID=279058 RepID=UPI0013E3F933|nr:O-antigen ligase family protein [Collimonas arenae]